MTDDDEAWFAPKQFGYGAGMPIRWQGWLVTFVFMTIILGAGLLTRDRPPLFAAIVGPAVIVLMIITAKTTRGGWRWRWGERD